MTRSKGIADIRHQMTLCSQRDVVQDGGELHIRRAGMLKAWAAIEAKKASTFSLNGAAMKDSRDQRTHIVTMRYRPDINVSAMAWLYEARLQSSPRWFKVLSVSQSEGKGAPWLILDCRIFERGDDIAAPVADDARKGPVTGLPDGVRL